MARMACGFSELDWDGVHTSAYSLRGGAHTQKQVGAAVDVPQNLHNPRETCSGQTSRYILWRVITCGSSKEFRTGTAFTSIQLRGGATHKKASGADLDVL
jgi:hypothetical protein